ncbi:hypothetical protein A0256_08585 [Mucilaginibacter sp. PAMC 26640]|nr:hypothetical protein A0256_08585 [Mucilaginibacter sp. PAMC 26640]
MINSYLILQNGEETGPFTLYELMDQGVEVHTMVLSPLANDWQEAGDLPEFNVYFKKLGIFIPNRAVLANFWWRLLAYALDYIFILVTGIILAAIFFSIAALLGHTYYTETEDSDDSLYNLFGISLMILYHSVLEATRIRGGFGKKICGLAVVDENGRRINFGKALSRNLGKVLSTMILGIGFLCIFWDDQRQGWHDGLAKTYVVKTR